MQILSASDLKTKTNNSEGEKMAEKRISQVQRKTNETDISLSLNLDGNGKQNISTGAWSV